jgi:hypothetical protein
MLFDLWHLYVERFLFHRDQRYDRNQLGGQFRYDRIRNGHFGSIEINLFDFSRIG